MDLFDYLDKSVTIVAPWIAKINGHKVTINNNGTVEIDGKLQPDFKVKFEEPFYKIINEVSRLLPHISDDLAKVKSELTDAPSNVKSDFNKIVSHFDYIPTDLSNLEGD